MNNTVFDYTDYRTFLKDFFKSKKTSNARFTLGVWSNQLQLSGPAVLANILNGKRNPGHLIGQKFVQYFSFSPSEKQYFLDLINLAKVAGNSRLSLALMEKISHGRSDTNYRLLDDRAFSTISKWYYHVIKELVILPSFKEDMDWMKATLEYDVSSKDLRLAIQDLLELEILVRDEQGKLNLVNKQIRTSSDSTSEAIKRYHEEALENGKSSLRKHHLHERDFSSRTIMIREDNIPYVKECIKEFRDKISSLFEECAPSSRVYQLNIQLIPMTKVIKEHHNDSL